MQKKYPKQFKIDTVKQIIQDNKKVKDIANENNIPIQTLYNWISTYKKEDTFYNKGHRKNSDKHYLQQIELENAILKKALFLPEHTASIFEFIYKNKDQFPVITMCNLLNVSQSGYYKYIKDITSAEQLRHQQIEKLVRDIYIEKGPNIGSPAITAELNKKDHIASQATVARILKKNKEYWHANYTKFHQNEDVQLHFPNKDTLYDKENQLYYHHKLAKYDINALLSSAKFTDLKKHESDEITKVDTFHQTDNLIIHGDNLYALHLLQKSFANKIKLIYIDPPYNTNRNNLSYHDYYSRANYLILLKNRLETAWPLLKKDGVIFIHCDDNQQSYIKVLCDELFGENNFVNQIIWQRKTNQQNRSHIATTVDYILVYAKNKSYLQLNKKKHSLSQLKTYKFQDQYGRYRVDKLQSKKDGYYNYSITDPFGKIFQSNWMCPKHTFEKLSSKNLIYWSRNNVPYKKVYLEDKPSVIIKDLWLASEYGTTRQANSELLKIIGDNNFTYPKPEKLMKQIIELTTVEDDIVLDFFSGSGSTLSAALQLNRQFVGVELLKENFNLIKKRLYTLIQKNAYENNSFITTTLTKK